ncbi:MAG: DUF3592 domain-containing protein [Bacilli bacterium]|nr:DUF3592 domain-containing protein [Bacilli bacterium]
MNKYATFLRESGTARFFIPVGIFLIIFGIAMFIINKNNQDYIKTSAIVSKIELVEETHIDENGNSVDALYKVYVKYTVEGNQYEEELGELAGYKKGDKITIYYDPDNPKKITQTKSLILPIAFIIGGCASLVCGIISAIHSIKRLKKMKEQEKRWNNE